jgi:hypothetical protein
MGLAGVVATIILPTVFLFQARGLAEVSRSELRQRAERLLRFLADDLRESAFQTGPAPARPSGAPPVLIHASLPGNPAETLSFSLHAEAGGSEEDDALTIVKAEAFFPPLRLRQAAAVGATTLFLDRRPNQAPGSSREIRPAPEAISHVVLAGEPFCYPVGSVGQELQLLDALPVTAPAETELFGVRARRFSREATAIGGRLRSDDFTSSEILDDAVDGLQFEYLLSDGRVVDLPENPAAVRGIRVSLLVRDLRPDRDYRDTAAYRMGNRSYGPYHDRFRRLVVSQMVEVKNHASP